ncbi:MAG: hypothetical protein ACTHLJ_12930, partial [Angustibacter sp.]
ELGVEVDVVSGGVARAARAEEISDPIDSRDHDDPAFAEERRVPLELPVELPVEQVDDGTGRSES